MKRRSMIALLAFGFAALAWTPQASSETGWITLFDGKNLDGFTKTGDANWRVEDGAIVADKGKGGFLMSKDSYKDFQLRIEFWAAHNANSGIYMRCSEPKNLTDKTCYEANIFDQRPDQTYATGAITHLSPIKNGPKAGGKWNTFDITAQGPRITVVLNGVKTGETDKAHALRGNIGLQWAQGVVKFRKVEIRPL